MKKLMLVLILFFGFVLSSHSQNLFCTTYGTVTKDTITINGTDQGSDWFSVDGYKSVWVEVWNGTYWKTYEVDYPTKDLYQIQGWLLCADSSIVVNGKLEGGIVCQLPIKTTSATRAYKVSLVTMTANWVRFRGYK